MGTQNLSAVRAKTNLFFGVYLSQWKIHSCIVTIPKDKSGTSPGGRYRCAEIPTPKSQ